MSVTDSLCLSHTVSVCHRQYVSVTDSLCLSQTNCVCHRQPVSLTENLCPSLTVCFCHRQSISVTKSWYKSQKFFACQRMNLSVTESLCLSKTVCFCYISSVFVTYSLCLWQKVFVRQSVSLSKTLLDHSWNDIYLFIHAFSQDLSVRICTEPVNQRNQLLKPWWGSWCHRKRLAWAKVNLVEAGIRPDWRDGSAVKMQDCFSLNWLGQDELEEVCFLYQARRQR